MTISKKVFIEKYIKALDSNTAAVFAGAGLSCGAGYVNWKKLLEDAASEIDLNIEKEAHDLASLAQYYINKKGSRGLLNDVIMEQFSRKAELTENHKLLAKLPINTFWTTNYDCLLEKALESAGKVGDIKTSQHQLTVSVAEKDVIVYKMHGDVSNINKIVLTRDDYEKYNITHPKYREILEGDLLSKTFLFIGFSFSDPNISYILSKIRLVLGENTRSHYCILKKAEREEFDTEEEYIYAQVKQKLHIEDLARFSIHTLLVDSYDEITGILDSVYKRYRRKTILISGSASNYSPFTENTAKFFLHNLSKELVGNEFKIVSGFGLGVGSYIINGVVNYMNEKRLSKLQNHIRILPFPQDTSGNMDLREIWKQNRLEMISETGIAIFIFGNKIDKKDGSSIVNANGLLEEFIMARDHGLILLPLGITGYMSQELAEAFDVENQFNDEAKDLYIKICNIEIDYANIEDMKILIDKIVTLVNIIKRT